MLTPHLREAVLSSTNNVFVFRTGIREANAAEERLGRWGGGALTRLARLTAAVTVNTGDGFTEPFTLRWTITNGAGQRTRRARWRSNAAAASGSVFAARTRASSPPSASSNGPAG